MAAHSSMGKAGPIPPTCMATMPGSAARVYMSLSPARRPARQVSSRAAPSDAATVDRAKASM